MSPLSPINGLAEPNFGSPIQTEEGLTRYTRFAKQTHSLCCNRIMLTTKS